MTNETEQGAYTCTLEVNGNNKYVSCTVIALHFETN